MLCLSSLSAFAKPVAGFSANPVQGCNPLKVDFKNTSTGAVKYLWVLGNGNQSTLTSPSAVYNTPGKYPVVLIATDDQGNRDTLVMKDFITVFKSPFADFNTDKKVLCAGEKLQFSDNTTLGDAAIVSFKWDFGNGDVATGPNPLYTYTVSGEYDITFAVEDANGCISSVKENKFINVHPAPSVSFSSEDRFRCTGPVTVHFTSSVSGNGPFKYFWNLGNNTTSNQANPTSTYSGNGNYNVSLTVEDAKGCKVSQNAADFVKLTAPVAEFGVSKYSICEGETVQFANQSWPWQPSKGDSVNWSFGDGTTAGNLSSPVKTYNKAGKYTVTLTYYWDNCVDVMTKTDYIEVRPKPFVQITPRDTIVCRSCCVKHPLTLKGNDYTQIQWQRDNRALLPGDTGNTYRMAVDTNGYYTMKVRVVSTVGCGEYQDSLRIRVAGPYAEVIAAKTGGCIPYNNTVSAGVSSQDPIVKYSWTSKDLGLSSDQPSMSFVNNRFGWSKIFLEVTDINGCKNSNFKVIGAGIPVDADYDIDKKVICNNEPLTIYNRSKQRHPDTVAFFWSWFGNDTISLPYEDSTKVQFRTKPGDKIKLSFTSSSYGCTSKDSATITVLGPLVDGLAEVDCEKDSLTGINNSVDFTQTYWEYINAADKKIRDGAHDLHTKLIGSKDLWLFAFNSKTGCRDSILIPFTYDPQIATFKYSVDCYTRALYTDNQYTGLFDTFFQWTLTNHTTNKVFRKKCLNLKNMVLAPGNYTLSLEANNSAFMCTRSHSENFTIYDWNAYKPSVTADESSCYPIHITLKDPGFNLWKNAVWVIDNKEQYADSAAEIKVTYTGNKPLIYVKLLKYDGLGCLRADSFPISVGGPAAYIGWVQNRLDCERPLISFFANNSNHSTNRTYTYQWDFGHRTSNQMHDTVQLSGSQKLFVTLTITTDNGCVSKVSESFDFKMDKPRAYFKTLSDTFVACPPLNVAFLDSSDGGRVGISSYFWDFGDNSYSVKKDPSKMYVVPGKYGVSLIVTNGLNCKDTFSIPNLVVVKGPIGSVSFDKNSGCTPMTIGLNAKFSNNVAKLGFDMGDGMVHESYVKNHVYTRPGTFIPRMIMIDSNGCKYSPEPRDTINVYASPIANFTGDVVCNNRPFTVQHASSSMDPISSIEWSSNGAVLAHTDSFSMIFNKGKVTPIDLKITTINQCSDSTSDKIISYGVKPDIRLVKDEFCLGEEVKISDFSKTDTTVFMRNFMIGGKPVSYKQPFTYTTDTRGILSMSFTLTDVLGCSETITKENFIKVGDTAAPAPLLIYRTTVIDDFSTETKFARSLQPDFKYYELYTRINNSWQKTFRSDNLDDTIVLTENLNTLKNSYCHMIREMNYCGTRTDSTVIVPHCTIETRAKGDTNVSLVNWSPYKGWQAVGQYKIWRKKQEDRQFDLLAVVPGHKLSYNDSTVWCHMKYDYRVEGVEDGGFGEHSFSDTANCKPIHFNPVPAPEIWRTTVNDNAYTHTEWIMAEKVKFPVEFYTLSKLQGNRWEVVADKVSPATGFSFDDTRTDVQNQFYTYRVTATDVCGTRSSESNTGTSILLSVADRSEDQSPLLTWTPYSFWNEGVETYRIERSISGGDFMEIGRVAGNVLEYTDNVLPVTCAKNINYRVVAERNQPDAADSTHFAESVSNHTGFVPEIKFWVPTAFTPDENNLNEKFRPDGVFFAGYEMQIYNRWGQKIYDNSECLNGWDGRYQEEISPEGVYTYHILAEDMGGKRYQYSGTFHLLR